MQFLKELVTLDGLEEAFNLFLVHRPDLDEANAKRATDDWITLLKQLANMQPPGNGQDGGQQQNQQHVETALKCFVDVMASQRRVHTLKFLKRLLEATVEAKAATARQVCDAVLSCKLLEPENGQFWLASFVLVRKVVAGVDYKGVREIMKTCIEKVMALPADVSPEISKQVDVIKSLISYIFDRNAALLPG